MKSLTVVRKKTLYPVEFKIKRVELSHCSEMSVALLAGWTVPTPVDDPAL